ncbi:MAG TPA: hypothetical protein VMW16_13160 [Sedimentisphaerales bacterium]|nr:hypothetical protein [Sedimentisphaerales bacterium]
MRRQSVLLLAISVTMMTASQPAAAMRFNVTDLGTLPGYNISQPYSINNHGHIAGYVWNTDYPGYNRAVLFDPNGTGNDIDLGALGGEQSVALSINNKCEIVGSAETDLAPSIWYATIFDPNGTGNNRALPPEGAAWQNNDSGQIVGFVLVEPSGGGDAVRCAALFKADSEPNMVNLGTLDGYNESEAVSINNCGLIVGTAYNHDGSLYFWGDMRAVRFDSSGGGYNFDLGTLPGYQCAVALSVNDRGQIVGRANPHDMLLENWNPRAVLFDPTGQGNNTDLGTLPGYDSAEAFCINNNGWIVGRAVVAQTFATRAVLFERKLRGNNIDLNDCIDPDLGCILTEAISINDNGWIVCWGGRSGSDATAFLLKPIPAGSADFEPDTDVDLEDFAVLAAAWRSTLGDDNWNGSCDISEPPGGIIDERDLSIFTDSYLISAP